MTRRIFPKLIRLSAFNITFRAERSLRMLTENGKLTYDQFIELKHSTKAEMADRILQQLRTARSRTA